ncbi:MAG: hypothetical protein ACD_76C00067G0002 [uncultured bacterium]|nr:MAG: hypothetical protein ACD_76C00067G0002 [uncultured bacterium]HBD04938.1 endonuclease III [Candidatus Uhrbacteria bacterium]
MEKLNEKKLLKRALNINRALKKLYPKPKIALKYRNAWELLVSVVLSAQCTDKKVNEVTADLFSKYKKLSDYVRADLHEFQNDIKPTGFYRNKAKHILKSAKIVQKKFNGKVPCKMENLLLLPGIARKSANIILSEACGIIDGIPVDTHVRRLSKLHKLTKNDDPVKIEQNLMRIIPRKDWYNFSVRLIQYGREYCPAKKHAHKNCPLEHVK